MTSAAIGTSALRVAGLNAFYGKSQVLFDLDLEVEAGKTLAILGRNGAGKTSTLLALMGSQSINIRAEHMTLLGVEISDLPAYRRVRSGLAFVPSGARAFANLSVHENLITVRGDREAAGTADYWTLDRVYDVFPKLKLLHKSAGGSLSGGERQMLAVGRALMANPRVLLLDEPSEGLAPLIVRQLSQMVRELNGHGLAVLMTEQNHHVALAIADDTVFIEKGRAVWTGDAAAAGDPDVIGRFLAV